MFSDSVTINYFHFFHHDYAPAHAIKKSGWLALRKKVR